MKHKIILLITVFLFFSGFGQNKAQISVNSSDLELQSKVDEYFSALTQLKQFNGNLMVARNGEIILNKTYNLMGGPKELKIDQSSKFIIASVSKVFVKYGILKLVEDKKISLNDPLSRFYPDFPNGNKITISHLMHHQSGLPREIKDYEKYDRLNGKQIIELAKKEKLQFEPGTKTLYSNIGYLLLHNIIDQTSKEGYLSFIKKEIFDPVGLKNTDEYNNEARLTHFAKGFDLEDGKITQSPAVDLNRFETGNYVSTIEDLYRFSREGFNGKHLPKELVKELFDENQVLAQAGGRPGYRAYFYKNLKTGIDFIFVSNYTGIPIQQTTEDIIKITEGKPYKVPQKIERKEITLSEKQLKKYEGKYILEADNSQYFIVTVKEGKLLITDKDGEISKVFPDSETTFFFNSDSNDGLVFNYHKDSGKYELTIISGGLNLKTKKTE